MSEVDRKALDVVFKLWRDERMPTENEADAFERFANEQVLKNPDLSDDEIESGNIGSGGDGGVDGFFFFVGDTLMQEGKRPPESATTAELILVQSIILIRRIPKDFRSHSANSLQRRIITSPYPISS